MSEKAPGCGKLRANDDGDRDGQRERERTKREKRKRKSDRSCLIYTSGATDK